ncbi:MAG: hypothetical protein CM15mP18_0120 [Methanobacteriota archaeon]|nr:MAG: hypothetical protein CM15mP18_0120 [Euryarchaeota archaeon]
MGHTTSSLVANVACGGRSRSVGTGRLVIDAGADGTDAGQVFRNLLLSQGARADAIPELEVLADDVSAAHGAASASLDEGQLHYLMSRGLGPEEASPMIVEGFLADAFRPSLQRRQGVRSATGSRFTGLCPHHLRSSHGRTLLISPSSPDGERQAFGSTGQRGHDAEATGRHRAMNRYYTNGNANVHRAVHTLQAKPPTATKPPNQPQGWFNADRVVMTSGTTEAIKPRGARLGPGPNPPKGDAVVLTQMEHHSDIAPWQMLSKERGVELRYVPVLEDMTLDMEASRHRCMGPNSCASCTRPTCWASAIPWSASSNRHTPWGPCRSTRAPGAPPRALTPFREIDGVFAVPGPPRCSGPTGIGCLTVARRRSRDGAPRSWGEAT